jgi:hypothetical protein
MDGVYAVLVRKPLKSMQFSIYKGAIDCTERKSSVFFQPFAVATQSKDELALLEPRCYPLEVTIRRTCPVSAHIPTLIRLIPPG